MHSLAMALQADRHKTRMLASLSLPEFILPSQLDGRWQSLSTNCEVCCIIALNSAIGFLDVRIALEIVLVNDAPSPGVISVSLIQCNIRFQLPLTCLPCH